MGFRGLHAQEPRISEFPRDGSRHTRVLHTHLFHFAVNSAKYRVPVVPAGEVIINTTKANTLCMIIF